MSTREVAAAGPQSFSRCVPGRTTLLGRDLDTNLFDIDHA
jgi:hypothetical protein